MRYKPAMLPCISLNVLTPLIVFRIIRVEIRDPFTVRSSGSHKPGRFIEQVCIITSTLHIRFIIFSFTQFFSYLRNTPIVISIFKRNSNTPAMFILWQVFILAIGIRTSDILHRAFLHCFKCFFFIKTTETF
ncbi:hypothetical protein D3C78_1221770 [compost metagenome]